MRLLKTIILASILINFNSISYAKVTIDNALGAQPSFPSAISQTQRGPLNKNLYDFLIYTDGGAGPAKSYHINLQTHSEFSDNIKGPFLQLISSTPGYANVPLEHQKLYFNASYQPCDDGTAATPPLFKPITTSSAEFLTHFDGEQFVSTKACDSKISGSIPGTLRFTLGKVDGFIPAAGTYQGRFDIKATDSSSQTTTMQLLITAQVSTIINVPQITIHNLGNITKANKSQSYNIRDYRYNITSNAPNGIKITGVAPYSDSKGAYISKPSVSNPTESQRVHFSASYESCQGIGGLKPLTLSNQTQVAIPYVGFNQSFEKFCDDDYGYMPGYLKFTRLPISTSLPEAGTFIGTFTIRAEAV